MKNLIAELLLKLAEKQEESEVLVAQVNALQIIVCGILKSLLPEQLQELTIFIKAEVKRAADDTPTGKQNINLLEQRINKILADSGWSV